MNYSILLAVICMYVSWSYAQVSTPCAGAPSCYYPNPGCYWGADLQYGPLSALSFDLETFFTGLSGINVPNLINGVSCTVETVLDALNIFQSGVPVMFNITKSNCQFLTVTYATDGILGSACYTQIFNGNSVYHNVNEAVVYCQSANGCGISLTNVMLNGQQITQSINCETNAPEFYSIIHNSELGECSWSLTGTMTVTCAGILNPLLGGILNGNSISSCQFLFPCAH